MTYKFRFEAAATIPQLAWCATCRRGENIVHVRHGVSVETSDRCFFEGAWDGDFSSMGFLDSMTCAGSGGFADNDCVFFCAPTHTLERLFLLRYSDTIFVSNSMVFALVAAGDDIDVEYPFYNHDFASVIDGIDKYVRAVPTSGGRKLEQYYCCNLSVSRDLQIEVGHKNQPAEFSDYSDYAGFLQSSVDKLCANASDKGRVMAYLPLATVSSGYDSPAAAVLAEKAGCRDALTFVTAREDFENRDDSGEKIGEKLGMAVQSFDRTEYLHLADLPEAEFLATGMTGTCVEIRVPDASTTAQSLAGSPKRVVCRATGSGKTNEPLRSPLPSCRVRPGCQISPSTIYSRKEA